MSDRMKVGFLARIVSNKRTLGYYKVGSRYVVYNDTSSYVDGNIMYLNATEYLLD